MKFVSEHKNPLRDLVELKTKVAAKEDNNDKYEMLVELRVHPHEIDEKIGTINVEITEAILSVEFSGLEVVPKTKLGQPIVDPADSISVDLAASDGTHRLVKQALICFCLMVYLRPEAPGVKT